MRTFNNLLKNNKYFNGIKEIIMISIKPNATVQAGKNKRKLGQEIPKEARSQAAESTSLFAVSSSAASSAVTFPFSHSP
jgi:hypothetical protein